MGHHFTEYSQWLVVITITVTGDSCTHWDGPSLHSLRLTKLNSLWSLMAKIFSLWKTKLFLEPLLISCKLLAVTNLQIRTLCMIFMKSSWTKQKVENWQNRSLCELFWHWECLSDATAHFDAFFVKRTQLGQSLFKIAYSLVCLFVCFEHLQIRMQLIHICILGLRVVHKLVFGHFWPPTPLCLHFIP